MEYIVISKRIIKGRTVCNKRFSGYGKGYWGRRIPLKEYNESVETANRVKNKGGLYEKFTPSSVGEVERIMYEN